MVPYRLNPKPVLMAGFGALEAPVKRRRRTICASNKYPFEWLRVDVCLAKPVIGRDEVPVIRSSREAVRMFHRAIDFGGRGREYILVMGLDGRNRPTGIAVPTQGSLTHALVDMASILRPMILSNSVGMIFAHNHPSNETDPSSDDIALSERLRRSGELIGVKLVDSIVMGDQESDGYFSMLDAGLLGRDS